MEEEIERSEIEFKHLQKIEDPLCQIAVTDLKMEKEKKYQVELQNQYQENDRNLGKIIEENFTVIKNSTNERLK